MVTKAQDFIHEHIAHVSTKPWDQYKESDYSLAQWHKACLIHMHDGPPTSKDQCKLPVRTPNGALNKYGVIAAAAVLDGARAPVDAPTDKKKAAARALLGFYKEFNSDPPVKLKSLAQSSVSENLSDFLEHYGVKGMRWGVRRKGGVKKLSGYSRDAKTAAQIHKKAKTSKVKVKALSNNEINTFLNRVNLESRFNQATPSKSKRVLNTVKSLLGTGKTVNEAIAFSNSPSGQAIQKGLKKKSSNSAAA